MTRYLWSLALLLSACEFGIPAGRQPHHEFNFLDMADQPKQKPQRGDLFGAQPNGMRAPPFGARARGQQVYPFSQAEADLAGEQLKNPLKANPQVLAHGKFIFENICVTCHGPKGAGDGHLTKLFPAPPSLMAQKVRDWPDGRIFHVPMRGQGSMPSHASQIEQEEIWAVIHHIRKLQSELPVAPAKEVK